MKNVEPPPMCEMDKAIGNIVSHRYTSILKPSAGWAIVRHEMNFHDRPETLIEICVIAEYGTGRSMPDDTRNVIRNMHKAGYDCRVCKRTARVFHAVFERMI